MKLRNVFLSGIGFSLAIIGSCFWFFAWQAAGRKKFWLSQLDQEVYFSITRNAVTLAGALVVGVTIFFSYRKQQTAENAQRLAQEAQNTAAEAQRVAQDTLNLSLDKHDLEKVGELRNRYARSAEQLGSDRSAVQLAGLHSLASLSDDWAALGNFDEQQVCIALLCSFIKDSASEEPGSSAAAEAVSIVASRIRKDLSGTDRSWSGSAMTLQRADLGFELLDAAVRGGQLILRDCSWHETGMIKGLQLQSGVMALQGDFTNPWFLEAEFEGGKLEITPALQESEVGITFADCDFDGGSIYVTPFMGQAMYLEFMDCRFISGDVTITFVGNPSSIRFSGCTFESPDVVRVTSRNSTPPKVGFMNCEFSGSAEEMRLDPEAAIVYVPIHARPPGELRYVGGEW